MEKVDWVLNPGVAAIEAVMQRCELASRQDIWLEMSCQHTRIKTSCSKQRPMKLNEKYAAVSCAAASSVLQDISSTMLSSNFPGQLSSALTADAK